MRSPVSFAKEEICQASGERRYHRCDQRDRRKPRLFQECILLASNFHVDLMSYVTCSLASYIYVDVVSYVTCSLASYIYVDVVCYLMRSPVSFA